VFVTPGVNIFLPGCRGSRQAVDDDSAGREGFLRMTAPSDIRLYA
jgi:hypothetical protein